MGGAIPPATRSGMNDRRISVSPPFFLLIKTPAQIMMIKETMIVRIPVPSKLGTMVRPGSPPMLVAIGPCVQVGINRPTGATASRGSDVDGFVDY